jgi:5-methylcytosine-specific restriction endonuclease McrA
MKNCTKCKKIKFKSEFNKNKSRHDGLQTQCKSCAKAHCGINKEQVAVTHKAWAIANSARRKIVGKTYRDTNKEREQSRGRTYYLNNKQQVKVVSKAWAQANPERKTSHRQNRRALKLNSEGVYTVSDINILLTTQDLKCVYCKTDLIVASKNNYHVDHRMPLFLGGTNFPDNLQLLCPACNLSKGHKHPDIYEKQINYNQNKEL